MSSKFDLSAALPHPQMLPFPAFAASYSHQSSVLLRCVSIGMARTLPKAPPRSSSLGPHDVGGSIFDCRDASWIDDRSASVGNASCTVCSYFISIIVMRVPSESINTGSAKSTRSWFPTPMFNPFDCFHSHAKVLLVKGNIMSVDMLRCFTPNLQQTSRFNAVMQSRY
jgi:hypothetical protein